MMPTQAEANLQLSVFLWTSRFFLETSSKEGSKEPVFFLAQSPEGGRDLIAFFCELEVVVGLSSVASLVDKTSFCLNFL